MQPEATRGNPRRNPRQTEATRGNPRQPEAILSGTKKSFSAQMYQNIENIIKTIKFCENSSKYIENTKISPESC